MTWFKHNHHWQQKTGINSISEPGKDRPTGGIIVEDCHCGAVRTIEFYPGQEPVIRIAKAEAR
jgi:hypothetical protein